MPDTFVHVLSRVGALPSVTKVALLALVLPAALTVLERFFPARAVRPMPRASFVVNVAFWLLNPLLIQLASKVGLGIVLLALCLILGWAAEETLLDGYGPLARQPLWLQGVEILLLADFIDYWTHRAFHVTRAWRFHAIHHSPAEMTWLASARMHPVNDLVSRVCQMVPIMLLGFSITGVLVIVPYLVAFVILLHSNLNWTFGPLRWVVVSPLYHRWHHTTDPEGLDKNFAGLFPVWDVLFGTAHFPRREPTAFGVNHDPPPESLWGQLLYPFRPRAGQRASGEDAAPSERAASRRPHAEPDRYSGGDEIVPSVGQHSSTS